jgi:hypothetical protein
VSIGINLRKSLSATTLALAMAAALIVVPLGAQADSGAPDSVTVCNTANGRGGDMVVDSLDPQAPVHVNSGLREKQGGKNMNAAMHSRALSLCSVPADTGDPVPTPTDGGGAGGNNG